MGLLELQQRPPGHMDGGHESRAVHGDGRILGVEWTQRELVVLRAPCGKRMDDAGDRRQRRFSKDRYL
jgi:hypothetical protein